MNMERRTFLNKVSTCCRNNGDCEFMLNSIKDNIICSSSGVGAIVVFLLSHSKPKASILIYKYKDEALQ